MKKIGVSQKVVIFNKKEKLLTIHRSSTAPSNPNMWDLPGGEIDFGEDAIKSIIREVKEETGLKIRNIKPFDVESHTNKDGEFWVTICYETKVDSSKVILSYEHDDYKWVSPGELLKLKSSKKLKRFVNNI